MSMKITVVNSPTIHTPMKKLLLLLTLLLSFAMRSMADEAKSRPDFSTTIDFLDYVFCDKIPGNTDIYPLEQYEKRIREIAECGVKKIYLRVNCLGLMLYPTKVSRLYGEGYSWHWDYPEEAAMLTRTVRAYDVCKETIRLGHKYGLEVWAWDSPYEGGTEIVTKGTKEAIEATKNLPLSETFYIEHPEYDLMRNPRLVPTREELDAINRKAMSKPVAKIICTELYKRPPLRITKENLVLYVSDDNITYRKYDKPYDFIPGVTTDGFNTFTLKGLEITSKYVKFGHTEPFSMGDTYTMASRRHGSNLRVYDTEGELVTVFWRANSIYEGGENSPLCMFETGDCAFDYGHHEVGFGRGAITSDSIRVVFGIHEYCEPAVMEHQLARFKELAEYPFDGFMLNFRTHSFEFKQEEYGYNAAVRKLYQEKYGVDIWKEDAELGKLLMLRADAVARFFAGCKERAGNRPMYITGLPPAPLGEHSQHGNWMCHRQDMLPQLYHRYIAEDKSVDGIMMTGATFPEHFTPEVTGGRDIKLGVFREGAACARDAAAGKYDFEKDMRECCQIPGLDEIEIYEMLELTQHPEFRKVIQDITAKP